MYLIDNKIVVVQLFLWTITIAVYVVNRYIRIYINVSPVIMTLRSTLIQEDQWNKMLVQ